MSGLDIERPSWMTRGSCRGLNPSLFFPERGANAAEAKEVCRRCPVKVECLNYALDNVDDFGVWGGTTERDRKRIRRNRRVPKRQCPWCRGRFTPNHSSQLYCLPAHALAAKSARKAASSRRAG